MTGTPLRLYYTANICGDLDLLPRLHTFIRRLRALPADHDDDVALCAFQPTAERVLLLDLGRSCAPGIWHCAATGGRSVLLALDAMGFTAANVEDLLDDVARQRLHDSILGLALVDPAHPHTQDNLRFVLPPPAPFSRTLHASGGEFTGPGGEILTILLSPAASTHLYDHTLHLAAVRTGQLGMARLEWNSGQPALTAHQILDLPTATLPDPTIAAAVEFIRSEARQYQSRRASS